MILTQQLLLVLGLSASLVSHAQSRSARRLEGEGIIGGEHAQEGQFPYQVSLRTDERSICGGSIIGERFVVTAAHCVIKNSGDFHSRQLQVVAGTHDLNSKSSRYEVVIDVAEVFVPKEYDPTVWLQREIGDIAVLKLKENLGIKNNPNLSKLNLPTKGKSYTGVEATISGFGWTTINVEEDPVLGFLVETGGSSDLKMRYAKAKVIGQTECTRMYSDDDFNNYGEVNEKHICAQVQQRDTEKPEGVCTGDSGGPLVYENQLIGVVSTSPAGCRENVQPGVYTRVSEFVDFINKVVAGKVDADIRSTTL